MKGKAAETEEAIDATSTRPDEGRRKRAAVELIARHGEELKRTARRYSLCTEDAEDAYQRALEILLTKAPTDRPRDLLAWTTTVAKHEALAVRRGRQRLLGKGPRDSERGDDRDPLAELPSAGAGPLERLERREEIARSREAIRSLKPAERRALTLLAEGYSYAEIGEITGFSHTKINRSLAEGRERFRRVISSSEDGSRCAELRPLLSAFCDGETEESDKVREHLRACAHCRAVVRAYRTVPATVAALSPLPFGLAAAGAGGGGAQGAVAKGAGVTGGAKASGAAGLAKLAGIKQMVGLCAVAGTTACVATGVIPVPSVPIERPVQPRVEQIGAGVLEAPPEAAGPAHRDDNGKDQQKRRADRRQVSAHSEPVEAPAPAPVEVAPESVEAAPESVEALPPPVAAPADPSPPEAGGAAGEFGP